MKVGDVTVLFLFYIRTLNTSYNRRIKFKGGFRDDEYIDEIILCTRGGDISAVRNCRGFDYINMDNI